MSDPGRAHGRRGLSRPQAIVLGAAVASLALAASLVLSMTHKSDGSDSAATAQPAPDGAGATEATSIFDRGGPKDGVLLGRLTFGGRRDDNMRAELFIDNQIEPRLVRMCQAGWLPSPPPGLECVDLIHTGGYQVTTTLDWEATERATGLLREALAAGLQSGCDCYDGAIVTIDPPSGEILVYIPNTGSNDVEEKRARRDIDQLTEINASGSAFMPLTFLA